VEASKQQHVHFSQEEKNISTNHLKTPQQLKELTRIKLKHSEEVEMKLKNGLKKHSENHLNIKTIHKNGH
jgi:hypothetical protein